VKFAPTTTQYPAAIDDELKEKLRVSAIKAHKAINSRDFSVFDIRVDPEGNPFFLEASLYCSFAPTSAVVWMASGVMEHQELFRKMLSIGAERGQWRKKSAKENKNAQKSMKGKVLTSK
jgi:D-alanine-D-alanine ligase-like ATP-grasp enzyme